MATPDQVNKLNFDDRQSYDFILETQGESEADIFLNKKLQLYQNEMVNQQVLREEERAKRQRLQGNEVDPIETFSITPEQQEQAGQAIQNYLAQQQARGAPSGERTLPGITTAGRLTPEEEQLALQAQQLEALGLLSTAPSEAQEALARKRAGVPTGGMRQVPMSEVTMLRRERIPTPQDIQTQAEQTQQSITLGGLGEGFPQRLGMERTFYNILKAEYEEKNGPISEKFEVEQTMIEADLRALARERANAFKTAEGRAEELVGGEFGASRPRQFGSMYESPPTPRIIPRAIDPTGGVGGQFARDPESAREMSGFEALLESIKPQTIQTAEERRIVDSQKREQQQAFVREITKDMGPLPGDPVARQNMIDERIRQVFRDYYHREYDALYTDMKRRGISEEAAQASAKYNAAVRTRGQIDLVPDDNPMFGVVRSELNDEFGFQGALEKSDYAPFAIKSELTEQAMSIGSDLLQDLATEETPFTGEITESIGMTALRNLNLPFRVVLNPLEEGIEALAGGEVPSPQEQRADQFFDVKTYDFTEEVSGFLPTMDAYLKEVAVENARGYGLGNAIANYKTTPGDGRGTMFIGGTVVEILIPWGTLAKGTQKLASSGLALDKLARTADLAADARNLTKVGQASGNANILDAMTDIAPSKTFGYWSSTYNTNNKIAGEAARQMEAVDAARQYSLYLSKGDDASAAAIAAKIGDDPLQKPIFNQLIPLEQADAGRRFTELDKTLDTIAAQDTIYGDVAREIVREGRIDIADDVIRAGNGVDSRLGRTGEGGATAEQLTGRAAERLAKYNIQDFTAFTDRMAIKSSILREELPLLNERVKRLYSDNVNTVLSDIPEGKLLRRDSKYAEIHAKLKTTQTAGMGDTAKITDVLTPDEQMYLTSRFSEDYMMKRLGAENNRAGVFFQTRKDTERAMMAPELRAEAGARPIVADLVGAGKFVEEATAARSLTGQAFDAIASGARYARTLTPGYAAKTIADVGADVSKTAPKLATAREATTIRRAVQQAEESVTRLERSLPEAMSRYGRITKSADEAIGSMYRVSVSGGPNGTDPTVILTMSDEAAKTMIRNATSGNVALDDVMPIFRGLFPELTKADEAVLANQLSAGVLGVPDVTVANMQSVANNMVDQIPRLRTGMVGVATAGGLQPDVAKVMLAVTGNKAAKIRVQAVAQRELSPLSLPIKYRSQDMEKFVFKEAMDYLESGVLPDSLILQNRYNASLPADAATVRVVDSMTVREEAYRGALERRFITRAELESDIIDVANQIKAAGLELNLSPAQIRRQQQLSLESILENSGQQVIGVGLRKELETLNKLYTDPGSFRALSSNVEELSSTNPGLLRWTQQTLGLTAADIRRSFVSGQLGGKYIPNARYVSENAVTAPIISAVTAPGASNRLLQGIVMTKNPRPAQYVRVTARGENANDFLPGSRYTYAQVAEELQRRNVGSTSQSINLGDVALEDLRQMAIRESRRVAGVPYLGDVINQTYEQFRYIAKNPGFKTSSTSPGMRLAMNTDYYFRENVFVGALQDGKTFDQATTLARNAYLDYGKLPQWSKESWFRGALYFSFMYRTSVEAGKALLNPKAAANLARLARGHVAMAKYHNAYYYTGDQTLQSLAITAQGQDGDYSDVALYYRDPWMSNLITGSQALTFLTQAAQGDPEASVGRSIEGILDFLYLPALDVVRDLDPDFKKGVPPKTMYRLLMSQQIAGNIPDIFGVDVIPEATYFIDRYDLEVRPPSKMIPGSPTYDGYQYRFQTKEGYNKFYLDSLFMSMLGAQRLGDDATQVLIQSGYIPEGSNFGYLESGEPVLFLFGRQTPMRLPKEWEAYDRQMRAQQFRLRELKKTYGEPADLKAGPQK